MFNKKRLPEKLPKHIGFILDGNGRWAQKRGLPRNFGHKAGVLAIKNVAKALLKYKIPYASMFCFSTENWKRSKEEVDGIFELAKNYLKEDELKILNNLVSGYFDLAEINAIEHKPMYMADYVEQLDSILSSGNRKLLVGPGKVSHDQAIKKAKEEYRKYQEIEMKGQKTVYPDLMILLNSNVQVTEEFKSLVSKVN